MDWNKIILRFTDSLVFIVALILNAIFINPALIVISLFGLLFYAMIVSFRDE